MNLDIFLASVQGNTKRPTSVAINLFLVSTGQRRVFLLAEVDANPESIAQNLKEHKVNLGMKYIGERAMFSSHLNCDNCQLSSLDYECFMECTDGVQVYAGSQLYAEIRPGVYEEKDIEQNAKISDSSIFLPSHTIDFAIFNHTDRYYVGQLYGFKCFGLLEGTKIQSLMSKVRAYNHTLRDTCFYIDLWVTPGLSPT
jgi:hypothetical protein